MARLHRLSASALVVLLLVTMGVVLATRAVVSDQDGRLLEERANEVSLVFGTSISAVPATLTTLGHIARDGGTALFTREAAIDVASAPGNVTFALLRPELGSYVVIAEAGRGLSIGKRVSGEAASVLATAQKRSEMVTTPVLGPSADRLLGFALGGPAVPPGTVIYRQSALGIYRQSALGPLKAPRQAGTAPFHELSVVVYDSSRADRAQVLVTATKDLPLAGPVRYVPLAVGASHWLLAVS